MILEEQHIDFEQIYLSYFSKMKRFAREYVLSDEDAENIVQDVFLDFWEKKELLPLPINILAYLFTSIKNRCIDFLRHKIVQKEVENKMQEEYRLTLQMKYYSLGELDEGIFEKACSDSFINCSIYFCIWAAVLLFNPESLFFR